MKSIRQISEKHNINYSTICKRVESLKLVPVKRIWLANYYSNADVDRIINYKRGCIISDKKKILIVEYHLMHFYLTNEMLGNILNISPITITRVLNEYKKNDCVIVKSKL